MVCGADGFIGRATCAAFAAAGCTVVGVSRRPADGTRKHVNEVFTGDLKDPAVAEEALRSGNIGRIIFAAGPADVQRSFDRPAIDFADQTLPLLNVLEAARRARRKPGVLLVSSAAVYGQPASLPVAESAPPRPMSPYGYHKLMQESLATEYHAIYDVPISIARAFSTIGPGQRRLAVWDITRKALKGQFDFPGKGDETRDYLYIRSLADALVHLASHAPFEGEATNVASGRETRIDELARLIFTTLEISAAPRFTGIELHGAPSQWRADVSRLKSFGFEAPSDLEAGVADTVRWIRSHA